MSNPIGKCSGCGDELEMDEIDYHDCKLESLLGVALYEMRERVELNDFGYPVDKDKPKLISTLLGIARILDKKTIDIPDLGNLLRGQVWVESRNALHKELRECINENLGLFE